MCSGSYQTPSEVINSLTPNQIIAAIRANDLNIIKKLVYDGVKVKAIWSQKEVSEMLDVSESTVSRWLGGKQ